MTNVDIFKLSVSGRVSHFIFHPTLRQFQIYKKTKEPFLRNIRDITSLISSVEINPMFIVTRMLHENLGVLN